MDISVLSISVPIQLNQNTGTDIVKTDLSIYDWTYWFLTISVLIKMNLNIGTDIYKADMSIGFLTLPDRYL
jgi:hypothetical protein